MEQLSAEWFAARAGKVTASRIYDVCYRLRNGNYGADRDKYMGELIAERLTGITASRFTTPAMQWGVDTEAEAANAYQFFTGRRVETVGFVDHPRIPMTGASPDRLVVDEGLVEIKCPETRTHIRTLRGDPPHDRYLYQMQWQLACTGRTWCDFASYDPRLPGAMQLCVIRVDRDDALIAEIERDVRKFSAEINTIVNELRERYEDAA